MISEAEALVSSYIATRDGLLHMRRSTERKQVQRPAPRQNLEADWMSGRGPAHVWKGGACLIEHFMRHAFKRANLLASQRISRHLRSGLFDSAVEVPRDDCEPVSGIRGPQVAKYLLRLVCPYVERRYSSIRPEQEGIDLVAVGLQAGVGRVW